MKTSELNGAALDWAVAKIEYTNPVTIGDTTLMVFKDVPFDYHPSTDWSQGGPIIERENISITGTNFAWWECDSGWYAHIGDHYSSGPTPLIAAMRCYVASVLGDEVEIPSEVTA